MKSSLAVLHFALPAVSALAQTLYTPSGTVAPSSTSNVGIGRSDPVARLDVQGTTADASAWALWLRNSNGNATVGARNDGYFFLGNGMVDQVVKDASGKVGIGTISPGAALDVIRPGSSNVYENGIRVNRPDAQGQYAFVGYAPSTADAYFGSVYTGAPGSYGRIFLRQYAQGMVARDALMIDSSGNVGIGSLGPTYKLTLCGAGNSSQAAIAIQDSDNAGKEWRVDQTSGSFRIVESGAGVRMQFAAGGNVGIGTTNPTHKLAVNGTIRAKEVIVDTGWADHVFAADYRLAPLSEVEQHIQQNGHLPDVPSAADVAERGVSVGEIQKILLQKIEELTLHQIQQAKDIAALKDENVRLRRHLLSVGSQP